MSLQLDHVIIAVHDLQTAIDDYRRLGFTVLKGGIHANRATENALVVFEDSTYLELLTRTGEAPLPGLIDFSGLVGRQEGLAGFALRSNDLAEDAARLRANGVNVGTPVPGERQKADGTVIQWTLALIDNAFKPFLIQDITPQSLRIPTDSTITIHSNGALGLKTIHQPDRIQGNTPLDRYRAPLIRLQLLGMKDSFKYLPAELRHGVSFEAD
jgi:catechol 2,3-dioxygenase-like lactoylglutathione lyase family enzyme